MKRTRIQEKAYRLGLKLLEYLAERDMTVREMSDRLRVDKFDDYSLWAPMQLKGALDGLRRAKRVYYNGPTYTLHVRQFSCTVCLRGEVCKVCFGSGYVLSVFGDREYRPPLGASDMRLELISRLAELDAIPPKVNHFTNADLQELLEDLESLNQEGVA